MEDSDVLEIFCAVVYSWAAARDERQRAHLSSAAGRLGYIAFSFSVHPRVTSQLSQPVPCKEVIN